MIKPKVLFLCSDNSCRTQMAEAFLRHMAGGKLRDCERGAEATALDREAVTAMREVGLDISGQVPKKVDPFLRERVAYLVTLCDRAVERTCPIFPGATWRLTWPLENPATARSQQVRRAATRRVRDAIREHVVQFVQEHA